LEAGAFSIPISKSFENHWREYSYIGSITFKSNIQKNKSEALYATERYPSRVLSIYCSVILESYIRWLISAANFLAF
jgi:hypothetical protein